MSDKDKPFNPTVCWWHETDYGTAIVCLTDAHGDDHRVEYVIGLDTDVALWMADNYPKIEKSTDYDLSMDLGAALSSWQNDTEISREQIMETVTRIRMWQP